MGVLYPGHHGAAECRAGEQRRTKGAVLVCDQQEPHAGPQQDLHCGLRESLPGQIQYRQGEGQGGDRGEDQPWTAYQPAPDVIDRVERQTTQQGGDSEHEAVAAEIVTFSQQNGSQMVELKIDVVTFLVCPERNHGQPGSLVSPLRTRRYFQIAMDRDPFPGVGIYAGIAPDRDMVTRGNTRSRR